jgi:hypothetical protein
MHENRRLLLQQSAMPACTTALAVEKAFDNITIARKPVIPRQP